MPPTVPVNHYLQQYTKKMRGGHLLLFHANVFQQIACLKHSNFFKVKSGSGYMNT